MKIHNVQQGTHEWLRVRAGIPTASCFDKILTPAKLQASGSARKYMHRLLAEFMLGRPLESKTFPAMEHGKAHEAEAVSYYEFMHDVTTEVVGFITNDEGTIGVSPDRMVGDKELLEVKCPESAEVHMGYLLAERDGVDKEYNLQLQGQLWLTDRKKVTIISYFKDLPQAEVVVERDDEVIRQLESGVVRFSTELELRKKRLAEKYEGYPRVPMRVFEPGEYGAA